MVGQSGTPKSLPSSRTRLRGGTRYLKSTLYDPQWGVSLALETSTRERKDLRTSHGFRPLSLGAPYQTLTPPPSPSVPIHFQSLFKVSEDLLGTCSPREEGEPRSPRSGYSYLRRGERVTPTTSLVPVRSLVDLTAVLSVSGARWWWLVVVLVWVCLFSGLHEGLSHSSQFGGRP